MLHVLGDTRMFLYSSWALGLKTVNWQTENKSTNVEVDQKVELHPEQESDVSGIQIGSERRNDGLNVRMKALRPF